MGGRPRLTPSCLDADMLRCGAAVEVIDGDGIVEIEKFLTFIARDVESVR
jgi:hypothetical protein